MSTIDQAQQWVANDPDPVTQAELTAVIELAQAGDAAAIADLASRFSGPLTFGTAGLRGRIGAGETRMNRAVVVRAAAGLGAFLSEALPGQAARIAIGYDARYGSHDYAIDSAAVLTAAGHEVHLLPEPLPTPVLAFATRALDADAGVMVTASHNPPEDNGYKVYLGGRVVSDEGQGAQIVPPFDGKIAAHIAATPTAKDVVRATEGWQVIDEGLVSQYIENVTRLVAPLSEENAHTRSSLRIVLTPMHGVGGKTATQTLTLAGFTDVHLVAKQAEPDPDFPTVAFPNPEEPGAMDLAFELARTVEADIVIANDPDADRCAVGALIDGDWVTLHGDVVGSLLGEHVAQQRSRLRMAPGSQVLANSIVSSQLLAKIAAAHGHSHRNTLTGFKWIGRVPGLIYGYEEALGYCVAPQIARDKDGISAALVMLDFVANLKAQGSTLADAIDQLANTYGLHLTSQVSLRFSDVADISRAMDGLIANPPAELGGRKVLETRNLADGLDGLLPTTGLWLTLEGEGRVIIRPSGTEPKVKAYLEVVGADAAARATTGQQLAELEADVRALLGA